MALLALAFACMAAAGQRARDSHASALRLIWTFGCAVFILHVAAAFQFAHHWSHRAAYDATARQTRELLGTEIGAGLYVSYFFLAMWIADVIAWWAWPTWRERQRFARVALYVFMAFIAFNASVVFAPAPSRWVALGVAVALSIVVGICLVRSRCNYRNSVLSEKIS